MSMEPHVVQAVLHHYETAGTPRSTAAGRKLLEVWLHAKGLERDRWGNFLAPKTADGTQHRWHFKQQVVRHEKKKDGWKEWFNVDSHPIIEAAQNVVITAAKERGRQDIIDKLRKVKNTRKAASNKRAEASAKERAATSGPGFYVVNQTTREMGQMHADHERPFSNLEDAEEFARQKLYEFVAMKFTYLLPVMVIEAKSRFDAELPLMADAIAPGKRHIWWIDGKHKGHPIDPRQMKLPGFVAGRAGRAAGKTSGARARMERLHSTRNAEGLTWPEWRNAAGVDEVSTSERLRRAWEAGEDPTEYRARKGRSGGHAKAAENREGLTFVEWLDAAGRPDLKASAKDWSTVSTKLVAAWRAGEDPTEYRAKPRSR